MHSNLGKDKRFLELRKLIEGLEKDYKIKKEDILDYLEEIFIPVSIFQDKLSSFEAIVKYLIENKKKTIASVSKLTNRSKQNIWGTYNQAKKKYKKKLIEKKSKYDIPLKIISDNKYSVLESIVVYLRDEHRLSYVDISRIISRDQRTVWTVYQRAKK